jgi:tetratricopeptide (TPR) repeat protein
MCVTRRSDRRRRYSLRVLVCIGAFVAGCGVPQRASDGGAQEQRDPILEQYAALKAKAGGELPPESVLAEIAKPVVAAGLAQDEASAAAYVIDHYRDHELGIAATQAHLARLLTQGEDRAIDYSRALIADHGGAPTAACALDFLLDRLRNKSPDAYLKACEDAIQGNEKRLTCVALLSRINFHHDGENAKLAALDTLRFWRLYPEKVESVQLRPFFCGNLERAGWLLEADIMAASLQPAVDAAVLLDIMEAIDLEAALRTGQIANGMQGLFVRAPNAVEILEKSDSATLKKEELASILLHCSRIELGNIDTSRVLPLLSQYFDVVDAILLEENRDVSRLRLLNQGAARAVFDYVRIHEETKSFSLNARGARQIREFREALDRLADTQVRLCRDGLSMAKPAPCCIGTLSAFLEEIDTPWVNAAMLESFITSNPGLPTVPSLQMKLAKLQCDKLDQPQKAAETFLRVFKDAPDSPEAPRAALLGCILLIQEARHEAALTRLQELEIVLSKQDADYPLVLYLTGVCEHSLGFREEAEARITDLLLAYPGSLVSAKALLWLGSTELAAQEFREARSHFQELIERYPESPEAERAKEYVERLAKLPEEAP